MLTQRRVTQAIIGIQLVGTTLLFLVAISGVAVGFPISWQFSLAASLLYGVLLYAYSKGFEGARQLVVVVIAVIAGLSAEGAFLYDYATLAIVVPPMLALVLASPIWMVGSAVLTIGILAVRTGFTGVYVDPITLVVYGMIVGGMVTARLLTDNAQRAAEANASQAEEARARSEAQARELARKADELSAQNDQQRRLLDLVATLETPAVSLADGVLLAPVVGHLDSRRAQALTSRLLHDVNDQRARLVILDIAGVATVDTEVAHALLRAIQALRLLGCQVTLTGISAAVAATMTTLGINMAGVDTARTPQEALASSIGGGGARPPAAPLNGKH